ncbi:MAG: hypothetical protein ACK5N8_01265 [Alphaproteobacteria bacterium]
MSMLNITLEKPHNRYVKSYFKAFDGEGNRDLGYDVRSLSSVSQWGIKLGLSHFKDSFIKDYEEFNKANNKVMYWLLEGNNVLGEVSLSAKEIGALRGYAEPQYDACKNIFGVSGEYVIAPTIKMSPKANNKETFEKIFVGMAKMLKNKNVKQFLVNAPINNKGLNRYFSTICKFCKGKALKTKNTIEYLLAPNVEGIRAAFNEISMIANIKAKNGMSAVLNGLKEITKTKEKKAKGPSLLQTVKEKLRKATEIQAPQDNVKVYSIGYTAKDVLLERRKANMELRHAKFMGR